MIDLSDGLSGDLAHICELNAVGATINITHLPISDALHTYAHHLDKPAYEIALQGGEDYELLFTTRPESLSRIKRWNTHGLLDASHIGTITPKQQGLQMITPTGLTRPIRIQSYEHFRS
jgi:thiamine-monophosphate kinase